MSEHKRISVICNRCGTVLGIAHTMPEAEAKNKEHTAECEVLNGWA